MSSMRSLGGGFGIPATPDPECSHSEYNEKGGNSLIFTSSSALTVCFNIAPNFLETLISRSEISRIL